MAGEAPASLRRYPPDFLRSLRPRVPGPAPAIGVSDVVNDVIAARPGVRKRTAQRGAAPGETKEDIFGVEARAKLESIQRIYKEHKKASATPSPATQQRTASPTPTPPSSFPKWVARGKKEGVEEPAPAVEKASMVAAPSNLNPEAPPFQVPMAPAAAASVGSTSIPSSSTHSPKDGHSSASASDTSLIMLRFREHARDATSTPTTDNIPPSTNDEESDEEPPPPPWGPEIVLPPVPASHRAGKQIEEDKHRLEQREKQVELGMNTIGYKNYKRAKEIGFAFTCPEPKTPNIYQKCSKRAWDGQMRRWRQLLHEFDGITEEVWGAEEARKLLEENAKYEKYREKLKQTQQQNHMVEFIASLPPPPPYVYGFDGALYNSNFVFPVVHRSRGEEGKAARGPLVDVRA
eukprot:Sspe_Gene.57342::Locus_31469_Transcript_1_1_Confidence_1.000_Length_1432::g.57342::m.57342